MSENDYCHWAGGTTKVAIKIMGRNAWREKPWGVIGISENRNRGCGHDTLGRLFQVEPCADVILSAAAFRVILTGGGGAPIDFFSAAAESIKCRRRRRSSAWQAITIGRIHWAIAAPKFAPCIRPIKRVGLVLPSWFWVIATCESSPGSRGECRKRKKGKGSV